MRYADVVLPVPLPELFTYALPQSLQDEVQVGCRILVPFGAKSTTTALVLRLHDQCPEGIETKDILAVVDAVPVVLPAQLTFWKWMASYYLCTLGEVYKAALPGKMKKVRKTKTSSLTQSGPSMSPLLPPCRNLTSSSRMSPYQGGDVGIPHLSAAQHRAYDQICEVWHQHPVCLLHGVTSSGKTEIYIHLIHEAIARGLQVLFLLPEIVLTTQLTDRLRRVFGGCLGVYHSKYSDRQREEVWQRQLTPNPFPLIVGVRSSIFLPWQRLGLVIVDEEHENSFKQQEPAPRYHARDAAIMLAAQTGARTLLGTATPSFESYYNARMGKYGLVNLTERFGQVQLPEVEIVDVAEARRKKLMSGPFSPRLLEAMRQALSEHRQVILFQNRRGYAPAIECTLCGWTPRCPHCDVTLTLHKRTGRMTCHYCGFTTDIPDLCPSCNLTPSFRRSLYHGDPTCQLASLSLALGFGTERIEDEIAACFPEARVARMDLDTTRTRSAYEKLIHDFQDHQTDILVGTQMVTKGLDFHHVSLVGILSADSMLSQPDFRAYEHAFQMMAQVAGRAGRRNERGLVILQTRNPDLPIISQVIQNDYAAMYATQMEERRQFSYPPFVRLVVMYVKHRHTAVVNILARDAAQRLAALFGTRVLGPDEPAVSRISSLYIRRIFIKLEPTLPMTRVKQLLAQVRTQLISDKTYTSAQIYFDVDPF